MVETAGPALSARAGGGLCLFPSGGPENRTHRTERTGTQTQELEGGEGGQFSCPNQSPSDRPADVCSEASIRALLPGGLRPTSLHMLLGGLGPSSASRAPQWEGQAPTTAILLSSVLRASVGTRSASDSARKRLSPPVLPPPSKSPSAHMGPGGAGLVSWERLKNIY